MDAQATGRQLGMGRIVIGAALTLAPRLAGRGWLGAIAGQPGAAIAVRSLGARDIAIGAGLVRALDRGENTASWFFASAAADASDAIGTLIAWKHLPRGGRVVTLIMASGATVVGLRSATQQTASR